MGRANPESNQKYRAKKEVVEVLFTPNELMLYRALAADSDGNELGAYIKRLLKREALARFGFDAKSMAEQVTIDKTR